MQAARGDISVGAELFNSGRSVGRTMASRFIKLANVAAMTAVFAGFWSAYLGKAAAVPYFTKGRLVLFALFFLLYFLFGRAYDAFLLSYNRISEMIFSQFIALIETDFIMFLVTVLLMKRIPFIPLFLLMLLIQSLISVVWCIAGHRWYFRTVGPKKTIIVWDMRQGMTDLIHSHGMAKKFRVAGNANIKECIQNLSMLDGMEVVFIIGVHSHDRNAVIKYCVSHHITSFIIPRVGDVLMSGSKRMHMFHLPILRLSSYDPAPEYLFIKRLLDICLSLIALGVTSPVMLVTAILIKRYDGGPVLYRQRRLTRNGKEFDILKFRSMRVDAESDGVARLSAGEKDDRITPIGRKIRANRIDELPQFINILKGDMSIVGPRPERPQIAARYEEELPEFKLRLQAKCGLTGYAQVYGKYNTSPYDKLLMDLMYIAHPSIAEDVTICLATVKILFMKDSTEGVQEEREEEEYPDPCRGDCQSGQQ